jgi:glycogen synthase
MNILLWSHSFRPNIGGIETMAELLGREFVALGHQVTLVTRTLAPPEESDDLPFTVVRAPSLRQMVRLVSKCDIFAHNHLSLRAAAPLLFVRRPWLVVYHCDYPDSGVRSWVRPFVSRLSRNFACSRALASRTEADCGVLPNGYDDSVFRKNSHACRNRELIFVGRLIHGKGVHVLLEAVALLRARSICLSLTIVGEGPAADFLVARTAALGLSEQVEFVGPRSGRLLAATLNRHRILVAPSIVREAFGIIALEAIACGCIVVGSGGAGLTEAIGPCGETFPSGDAGALADLLARLWLSPESWPRYQEFAEEHLRKHRAATVAVTYLDVIREIVRPVEQSREPVGARVDSLASSNRES